MGHGPEMSPSLEDIRAVTFDVGGTLIEPWPSVGHVYAEVAARFGISGIAPEALNRQFAAAWRARHDFDYSRAAWQELVNQTFAGLCREPPRQDCFEAIYEHFATAASWRLFDDVLPALQKLKAHGLKLAVISNWDERLRPLLRDLRLDIHFDAFAISHETRCAKPAKEIFRHAVMELDVPPACILHVGDSADEDVTGARAAGINAALLNRKAAQSSSTVISSLSWLAQALDKRPSHTPSD
jgi:putative hydrolase of the HAD superfamily